MTLDNIQLPVVIAVAIGLLIAFLFIWPFAEWLLLSPEAYCRRRGHKVKSWRDTSGNGKFGTCVRCGEEQHEHEWS